MPLDPRTARSLLKLAKEFAEFDEIELSAGDVSVRVRRSSGVRQTEPVRRGKGMPEPVKRSAIESLRDTPPVWD